MEIFLGGAKTEPDMFLLKNLHVGSDLIFKLQSSSFNSGPNQEVVFEAPSTLYFFTKLVGNLEGVEASLKENG